MRRFAVLTVSLAACSGTVSGTHRDAAIDSPIDAASSPDSGTTPDLGATPDLGTTTDLGTPPPDLGAPPPTDACTPLAPPCMGGWCGTIPAGDGCGGALACDACSDSYDVYCTVGSAMHQGEVNGAVNATMTDHPELFDPVMFRDTSSWLVIDDAGYTAAVVAACNAMGAVCLSDPNDDHEMRVHGPGDHRAENYGIRVHSTNRTWTRFMGGYCETTLF